MMNQVFRMNMIGLMALKMIAQKVIKMAPLFQNRTKKKKMTREKKLMTRKKKLMTRKKKMMIWRK